MVDIADGIGMVSKVKHVGNSLFPFRNGDSSHCHMTPSQGIEALEYYIDPSAEVDEAAKKPEEPSSATDGSTPTVVIPGQPPVQPVAPVSPDQPAVFCQKGNFSFFFNFLVVNFF